MDVEAVLEWAISGLFFMKGGPTHLHASKNLSLVHVMVPGIDDTQSFWPAFLRRPDCSPEDPFTTASSVAVYASMSPGTSIPTRAKLTRTDERIL